MATHLQLPPASSGLQLHKFVTGLKDCVWHNLISGLCSLLVSMYAWTDGLPSYINPLFINPLPPYDRGPLALYDRNVYFYVQINYLTYYVLSYATGQAVTSAIELLRRAADCSRHVHIYYIQLYVHVSIYTPTAVIASISPTPSHQTRPDASSSSRVFVQPRPPPSISFRLVSSSVALVHVRRSIIA